MAERNIDIIIRAQNLAKKELDKISKQMNGLAKTTKKTNDRFKGLGNTMKSVGSKVFIAGGIVTVATKQMFDLAEGIQTIQGKADIVFGEYIDQVKKVGEETASAMGLSQNEFLNTATSIADVLKPLGFLTKEATDMSLELVGLSGVLAEWSNGQFDAVEAGKILTDAMVGQTERLKGVGIVIDQSSKAYKDRIALLIEDTGVTAEVARATDILTQITEKSIDAQKAFADGTDSLTRKKAEMTAGIKDARDSLAEGLTPAFAKLVEELQPTIDLIVKSTVEWANNEENIESASKAMKSIIEGFKIIWKAIKVVAFVLKIFKIGLDTIGKAIGNLAFFIYKGVNALIDMEKNATKAVITMRDNIVNKLKELGTSALKWGANMLQMFIDGFFNKIASLKAGLIGVADTIKDFLGFSSPTNKGPLSNSDKWIPNLISMMADGFDAGKVTMARSAVAIAKSINDGLGEITIVQSMKMLEDFKDTFETLQDTVNSKLTEQRSLLGSLSGEYRSLKEEIMGINEAIGEIKSGGVLDVAERAVELEGEIEKLVAKLADSSIEMEESERKKLNQKGAQLEKELELAKLNTTQAEIERVRIELAKSETQKIIDRTNAKLIEAEVEKAQIMELAELKKQEIISEFEKYSKLIEGKATLDRAYFDLYGEQIKNAQQETRSTITMLERLIKLQRQASSSGGGGIIDGARADGGSVSSGKTYLVGEKGPELFSPKSSGNITPNNSIGGGITINMGGVVVSNQADENRLVDKIKTVLIREAKLYNIGIS